MLEDFKKFIMRGNVLDLAVAVVIGVAFKAVIDAFVGGIVMPIIGIIGGKPSFDSYFITINHSQIRWGTFLTTLVGFFIIAASLFVMIRSFEALQARRRSGEDDATTAEPLTVGEELLTEIRDLLQARGGAA